MVLTRITQPLLHYLLYHIKSVCVNYHSSHLYELHLVSCLFPTNHVLPRNTVQQTSVPSIDYTIVKSFLIYIVIIWGKQENLPGFNHIEGC